MSSVLKNKRTDSKAKFVQTANDIYCETVSFLSRLSARYSRILTAGVMELADALLDNAEMGNSIIPSDEQRYELRRAHLLEARAALNALDVKLTYAYIIMRKNPQGCFTDSKGKTEAASRAKERFESMSDTIGGLIEDEQRLLEGILDSDRKRFKNAQGLKGRRQ